MKSFVKENAKIVLTAVITSIICISGTTFAARMMNAKDILFTATNANFKAGNVNEAIDDLYNEAQKEQKYSLEEQVVGTWIDGRPLYRKVYIGTVDINKTDTIVTLNSKNINELIKTPEIILKSNGTYFPYPRVYVSSNYLIGNNYATVNKDSINLVITSGSSSFAVYDYIIIVEYTKTTDEAKS